MITSLRRAALLASVVVAFMAISSYAVPVYNYIETWDSAANGWGGQNLLGAPAPSVAWTSPGGNPGGYMKLLFSASPGPASGIIAALSAPNFVTGAYVSQDLYATFDVLADTIPSSWALYLHSTSGRTWIYDLALPTAGQLNTWIGQSVPFSSAGIGPSAWHLAGPVYNLSQFLSDLGTVDWIGLFVARSNGGLGQNYGLDNFGLHVPEPGTWYVLSASLLSLCMTFRTRFGSAWAWVRGLIRR